MNTLVVKHLRGESKVKELYTRLIFHGGARDDSDNNAFYNAAMTVKKEYTDVIAKMHTIEDAEKIVKIINSEQNNTIQSIDIFSHSGTDAIYIHNSILGGKQSLYKTKEKQDKEKRYIADYTANLSDIDYNKFTNSAKIELHGCNAANDEDQENFAWTFSMHLYNAGKKRCVVIGHNKKGNPNKHKTLKGSDYRHGGRRVYHNGRQLFYTKKEGRITSQDINKYLE